MNKTYVTTVVENNKLYSNRTNKQKNIALHCQTQN